MLTLARTGNPTTLSDVPRIVADGLAAARRGNGRRRCGVGEGSTRQAVANAVDSIVQQAENEGSA